MSNSNSTGLNQAELWQHYLTQNPHWQEDGARLTAAGLKKLFEQTWQQGHKVGHQQAVAQSLRGQFGDLSDLFGNK